MEVSGELLAPAAFTPRKEAPGTHWIGSLVGPRAGLDAVVKRKIPSTPTAYAMNLFPVLQ
jgi:hypothetical protein